ncbi:MAG: ABC transporter ATP-binding protein [Acidimicrobiales bacterium]
MPETLADESARCAQHLLVDQVEAGYGGPPVIAELCASVGLGEVVCVAGPNGAGKSTLVKAIIGEIAVSAGTVSLGSEEITNLATDKLAHRGVGYVPQHEDVFDTLTVVENLELGGYLLSRRQAKEKISEILEVFPALKAMRSRSVGRLSGGERKMVAVGRVLMLGPSVLILDEPTAGLSVPLTRALLQDHVRRLADTGTGVLLIEQKATEALQVADWGYILVSGTVKVSASASELLARPDIGEIFLGGSTSVRAG